MLLVEHGWLLGWRDAKIDELTFEIAQLKRLRYGVKSEQLTAKQASHVDVAPTRGFNKSSASERTGADVARERRPEGIAEALRTEAGMDAKQFDTLARQKLAPRTQQECRSLDRALPRAEAAEQRADTTSAAHEAQKHLLKLRRRHLELGC